MDTDISYEAQLFCAAFAVASDGEFVINKWDTYLIFLAILTFSTAGNVWGNRILGRWNDFARESGSYLSLFAVLTKL